MTPIRALVFDAYGTLFDVLSVTSLCEELFPGQGFALAHLWRTKQLQYSWLCSLMARHKDFWQLTGDGLGYAAKSLRLPLTSDSRMRLMDAYLTLKPFADVVPGLGAVRLRGLRLAILSNGSPTMLNAAVTSAGLAEWFDALISVEDVKVFKPSPRVYQRAAEVLNHDPDEIALVSANSWDIHGAGSAGLRTFWLQRTTAEPEEELGYPASAIIHSLTELPAVVA